MNKQSRAVLAFKGLRLSREDCRGFSGPCLRSFFKVTQDWKLTDKEQMRLLGIKSYQALSRMRNRKPKGKVVLKNIQIEMLGWVFSIYKDLYILFKNTKAVNDWMKKPNKAPMFQGKSAMEYIMEGDLPMERMLNVRNYLRSQTN
jgi:hypothetical protein